MGIGKEFRWIRVNIGRPLSNEVTEVGRKNGVIQFTLADFEAGLAALENTHLELLLGPKPPSRATSFTLRKNSLPGSCKEGKPKSGIFAGKQSAACKYGETERRQHVSPPL